MPFPTTGKRGDTRLWEWKKILGALQNNGGSSVNDPKRNDTLYRTVLKVLRARLLAPMVNPAVTAWSGRVVTNGGSAPSAATLSAVSTFYNTLSSSGLLPLMYIVNVIAPDNLTAALTPLIVGAGSDPWTNHSHVASDLSIFGLFSDGIFSSTRYLDTGANLGAFLSASNGGMTLYTGAPSNGVEQDMGVSDNTGTQLMQLHVSNGGVSICDCYDGTTHRLSSNNTLFYGYTSMNRVANNDFRVFVANPLTAHAQLGSTDSTVNAGAPPTGRNLFVGARNGNGTPSLYSSKRVRFVAVHQGLSLAQSLTLSNAVQTLLTAFEVASGVYHPIVNDWARRVVANGGTAPGTSTLTSLSTFCTSLDAAGLTPLMFEVMPFVPDSLIAALTPLIRTHGNDPWTNNNFSVGDLTGSGLAGNGSNKYLKTGFNPQLIFGAGATSLLGYTAGMTIYNTTASNGTEQEMGCLESSAFQLHVSVGGNAVCDCWNDSTMRVNVANTSWTGYLSINRTAQNAYSVYKANGSTAHASIGSISSVNPAAPPLREIYCFCGTSGGGPFSFSAKTLGLAAIHQGLTQAQSLAFFNATKTLRDGFGP